MTDLPALSTLLPIDPATFGPKLAAAKARLVATPSLAIAPSLLPPRSSALERGLDLAMSPLSAIPTPIADVWSPDRCPVALLPYLAWALSVDVWSPDWPEVVKRERIRRAIAIQRAKGTLRSVEDTVATFGGSIALQEWWQTAPQGVPHTFDLTLSLSDATGQAPTAELVDQVISDIARTKPVRSHFTFTLAISGSAAIGIAAVARPFMFTRLSLAA